MLFMLRNVILFDEVTFRASGKVNKEVLHSSISRTKLLNLQLTVQESLSRLASTRQSHRHILSWANCRYGE